MTHRPAGWVRHFDFRLGGDPVGHVLEIEQADAFLAVARFVLDGQVVANRYRVELADGRPVRCRHGDDAWREVPAGVFPTCTYPLVLRSGLTTWRALDEGSGAITNRRFTVRDGWTVEVDDAEGTVLRRFRVEDDEVVAIDWGGDASSDLLDVERILCP